MPAPVGADDAAVSRARARSPVFRDPASRELSTASTGPPRDTSAGTLAPSGSEPSPDAAPEPAADPHTDPHGVVVRSPEPCSAPLPWAAAGPR